MCGMVPSDGVWEEFVTLLVDQNSIEKWMVGMICDIVESFADYDCSHPSGMVNSSCWNRSLASKFTQLIHTTCCKWLLVEINGSDDCRTMIRLIRDELMWFTFLFEGRDDTTENVVGMCKKLWSLMSSNPRVHPAVTELFIKYLALFAGMRSIFIGLTEDHEQVSEKEREYWGREESFFQAQYTHDHDWNIERNWNDTDMKNVLEHLFIE